MAEDLPVIGEQKAHAVAYASDGLEVFPVDPTNKTPMAASVYGAPSQYNATTDANIVAGWWDRWPDALIGHRFAEDQIALDIDPRHGGRDTWQALVDAGIIDPTIQTRSHYSGRNDGGGHLWFKRPPGKLTITQLDAWAEAHGTGHRIEKTDRWVCGLDLLHRTHRYTILPPSPHPETGEPYRWRIYGDVLDLPGDLAELLIDKSPPPKPREPTPYDGDSIADWYSATASWSQLLGKHGWTLRAGGGDDDGSQWRHPAATSPVSATIRHECLFVYSPNTPFEVTEPSNPHGVTRFRAFTILEHGGDAQAAARAARELKDGPRVAQSDTPAPMPDFQPPPPVAATEEPQEADEDESPRRVDIYWTDEVAADPPDPIDELVTNLVGIGEVTVFGAPRAMGKTWATMGLAADIAAGHGHAFGSDKFRVTRPGRVMYLQGELGLSASHVRWSLATSNDVPRIAEVFERLRVKTTNRRITMTADGVTWTDEESVAVVDDRLEPMLAELGADLLVIDPWATYFAGNENSNDEVEAAIDAITQMARRVGCAVWIVHHITAKASHGNLAEPEDLWRGASRLADAVSTRVTMLPHYTPAKARELGLDRFQARTYGDLHVLQRNGPPVPVVHCHLEQFRWQHWEPTITDGGRPTDVRDEDVVRVIRAAGGQIGSKRELLRALDVQSSNAADRCLDRLTQLGVVETGVGRRGATTYRVNEDELP